MATYQFPAGFKLILSGDRQLAGTFSKIAKRRAIEYGMLLSQAGLKMGKKTYYFTNCVWALINIVDRMTFIRIHACSEESGGCGFPVVDPDTIIFSEYQLICPLSGYDERAITFASIFTGFGDNGNHNLWQFEEGGSTFNNQDSKTNTYSSDGTYETSMIARTSRLPYGGSTSVEGKTGFGATVADAHAACLAEAWGPDGYSNSPVRDRVRIAGNPGPGRYEYLIVRHTVTFDVGVGTMYPFDIRNTAWCVANITTNPHRGFGYIDLPRRDGSGISNDHDSTTLTDDGYGICADLQVDIGSSSVTVTFKDINDWSIPQPDPEPDGGDLRGYSAEINNNSNGNLGYWNEYKTTKTIKVVGGGTIKQLGVSEHERISVP